MAGRRVWRRHRYVSDGHRVKVLLIWFAGFITSTRLACISDRIKAVLGRGCLNRMLGGQLIIYRQVCILPGIQYTRTRLLHPFPYRSIAIPLRLQILVQP